LIVVLILLLTHRKSHLTWYKNVIVLVATAVGAFYVCVRIWTLFDRLILILLRMLTAVISYISAIWSHVVSLLVM
jgi:hypothetical protein